MNFLGVGPFELLLVLIIATIVLGPERMAEAGRVLGRYYAQYRYRWKKDVDEMTRELRQELAMLQQELDQVRQAAESEVKAAQDALESTMDVEIDSDVQDSSAEPAPETSDREPIPTEAIADKAKEPVPAETETDEVEK